MTSHSPKTLSHEPETVYEYVCLCACVSFRSESMVERTLFPFSPLEFVNGYDRYIIKCHGLFWWLRTEQCLSGYLYSATIMQFEFLSIDARGLEKLCCVVLRCTFDGERREIAHILGISHSHKPWHFFTYKCFRFKLNLSTGHVHTASNPK